MKDKWFVKELSAKSVQDVKTLFQCDIFFRQHRPAVWTQHDEPEHGFQVITLVIIRQNQLVQSGMLGISWQKTDKVTFKHS